MDYDNDDIEQESGDLSNVEGKTPGVIDSATQSATHMAGKALAEKYAPGVGGKLYEAASNTKIGQAIEKKIAKRFSFKVKMTILGISIFCFLSFFIVYAFFIHDGLFDSDSGNVCINLPSIDNVCKSITLEGVGTMSIDEYVAGVISKEVGGFNSYSNGIEAMKANAIAARTYALNTSTKDGNGNCTMPAPSENSQDFTTPSDVSLSVAEETSGIVLVTSDNEIALSQYSNVLLPKPYSEFSDGEVTLMENNGQLSVPKEWADQYLVAYCDKLDIYRDDYNGYGCGHGLGMSQLGALYLAMEKNYSYTDILEYYYSDDGFSLSSFYSDSCSSGSGENSDGSNSGDNSGSASNGTDNSCSAGETTSSQPDPAIALNYWGNQGYINTSDFIYPTDSSTGYSLGAHPKNFDYKNLTSYNVYSNSFIWPTTPSNNTYNFVYSHNGIDIMSEFGTPVYSPVDGDMQYSEWGHTVNRGCDETAYTVSIKFASTTVNGEVISTAFLTHLSGIVYYCPQASCDRKVKKGELLGFVGNAAGTASSVGWAPHLHLTLYDSVYDKGLLTNEIEKLYNISSGVSRKAGE